jgi:hypothetical protein
MPKDINALKARLQKDPVARTKFVADMLTTLEKHGVDVHHPAVQKNLALSMNLSMPSSNKGNVASHVISNTAGASNTAT